MFPNLSIEQLQKRAEGGDPGSQFLLSQVCLQQNELDAMLHWLRRAAASGLPDAIEALGHCHEHGLGIAADYPAAVELYEQAAAAGSPHAAFRRAELLYKSQRGPSIEPAIRRALVEAAQGGLAIALRVIGYLAVQQPSSRGLGIDCLRSAAHTGDPVAAFTLAWAMREGRGGDRVAAEAGHWAQQAAAAGYPYAHALSQAGSPAVPPPPVAADAIDFGEPFPLYPDARDANEEAVCNDPPISIFSNVLNLADCAYLIFVSTPRMERANVIDPDSDMDGMVSDVRTSASTYIPFHLVDILSRYIELKIIQQTGEDLLLSEPMSILRYSPGEYYKPHVDYFNPKLKVSEGLLADGGQRTASAVTYLSTPGAGGGTSFPRLDIRVPAAAGNTLWFRNCNDEGDIETRSLHAGETVESGEKWVVTKWFRQQPTHYARY